MTPFELGKKPFTPDPKDFKLTNFAVSLPPAPKNPFGYGTLFSDWGMLGNDQYGDCVLAGSDHEQMLWNKLAKHPVSFTTDNALSDYSAITGFNPQDPNSDQGTVVRDAYNYRRTTGLIDAQGARHKIDAFVQIDAKNWDLMLACAWTFGVVGMGFEVPGSIWSQTGDGLIWDVSTAKIVGGHYVPVVGSMAPASEVTCITWGKRQRMSKAFYQKYNDEAWVPLTKESLLPPTNVRHIDWNALSADLSSL